jgi:hypothetical protein
MGRRAATAVYATPRVAEFRVVGRKPRATVAGDVSDRGRRRVVVVDDDVAEAPRAFVGDAAAALRTLDVDRRRETRRRDFGEKAYAPMVGECRAGRRPCVEERVRDDAFARAKREGVEDGLAEFTGSCDHAVRDRRIHRSLVRGHEHTGAVGVHLMLVERDQRSPCAVHAFDGRPRFLLRAHEPIAVVVVPDVLVIEVDHRCPLVGRADPTAIPVDHPVVAVRIVDGIRGTTQSSRINRVTASSFVQRFHASSIDACAGPGSFEWIDAWTEMIALPASMRAF